MGLIREVAGAALAGPLAGALEGGRKKKRLGESPGGESLERAQEFGGPPTEGSNEPEESGFKRFAKRAGGAIGRGYASRESKRRY